MGVRKAEARKKSETVDRGGYRHTGEAARGEGGVFPPRGDSPSKAVHGACNVPTETAVRRMQPAGVKLSERATVH